jgi:vancomycin resistance protein VanJ
VATVAAEAPPVTPPTTAPVLAISDLLRSAADQASATWKTAGVPSQRRESPATPFRTVAAPAPPAPALPPATPRAASGAIPLVSPSPSSVPFDDAPTGLSPIVPTAESPSPAALADSSDGSDGSDASDGSAARSAREAEDTHWPGARRQIALLTIVVSLLVLAVLLGHRYLPDVLGFGSLIDTFLPWTAAPLLLALPAALLSLRKWAIGISLLTCAVWVGDFAPTLARTGGSGPADIRVLSQNLSSGDAGAPDLSGIAGLAERRGADIVVLQGLSKDVQAADQAAPARYPYHLAMYEFVVWSRFPIGTSQPVDLTGGRTAGSVQSGAAAGDSSSGTFGGLLRFTLDLEQNRQVTVYAVHLPQPSLSHDGFGVARDEALEQLVVEVQAEKSPNLVVVGDLDVAQTDRAARPLLRASTGLVSSQAKAGSGFGFTWPATFPVVRLDDVLTRGLTPVASVVLPAVGPQQAHRPIEADLKF